MDLFYSITFPAIILERGVQNEEPGMKNPEP
jgi:hypothetical protein